MLQRQRTKMNLTDVINDLNIKFNGNPSNKLQDATWDRLEKHDPLFNSYRAKNDFICVVSLS
jgi:hypothetical protein